MSPGAVAGVDWAGEGWLAIVFEDGSYEECLLEEEFESIWKARAFDRILVDIPIGLPEGPDSLDSREELDSLARTVTGRSSSVFPAPSRNAAHAAFEQDAPYDAVVEANERDLGKGLTKQSYYIATPVGEIDAFIRGFDTPTDQVVESHPELCFRGLLGDQLVHSKTTAAGVGERLEAIGSRHDSPGSLLAEITGDLVGGSDAVDVDDVLDALALGVVARVPDGGLSYLADDWTDSEGIPMQMAYWAETPLD